MVDVFFNEFSYLKVDPELAQAVEHTDSYIKFDDGVKKERNIFFNVSYDEQERAKLKEIENLAQQRNISHRLFSSTGQILKFIYANQFDSQKALDNMIEHIQWLENPLTFNTLPLTISHLEEGYIYIGGTDKMMRPTAVFNVHKIDIDKTTEESILGAYNRIFKIIEEYFFFKSKIEHWNVIIETNEISALKLPIKILGKIITTMQNNFPSNLNKIFILNPSTSLNFTWKLIAAFINERSLKKISFLKKDEMKTMLDFYDPDQLEQRFGGTAPNVTKYYPPQRFQPSQAYVNKVASRKSQRGQMQMIESSSKYAIPENYASAEYQYRSTPQPTMYSSNVQVQYNFQQNENNQYDNMNQFHNQNIQQQQYGTKSVVQQQQVTNQQFRSTHAGVVNYNDQSQYQMVGSNAENRPATMRFTKQKQDDHYTISAKPPGFRNEITTTTTQQQLYHSQPLQLQQHQQQQQQPFVSKYQVVNDIMSDRRGSINILDNIEEDHDIVKRSKKEQKKTERVDVKDPKYPDYMDRLRDQDYKACTIF